MNKKIRECGSIEEAIKICIDHNVLKDYLDHNGSEVCNMLYTEFNLNGQEVPHLLGGGMNCPSAARLTFSLTYGFVYAMFEIKR